MTELKTLKDIQKATGSFVVVPLDGSYKNNMTKEQLMPYGVVYINDLRQEVIKWIKSLNERLSERDVTDKIKKIVKGQIYILNEFFNITKEDLK